MDPDELESELHEVERTLRRVGSELPRTVELVRAERAAVAAVREFRWRVSVVRVREEGRQQVAA